MQQMYQERKGSFVAVFTNKIDRYIYRSHSSAGFFPHSIETFPRFLRRFWISLAAHQLGDKGIEIGFAGCGVSVLIPQLFEDFA